MNPMEATLNEQIEIAARRARNLVRAAIALRGDSGGDGDDEAADELLQDALEVLDMVVTRASEAAEQPDAEVRQ